MFSGVFYMPYILSPQIVSNSPGMWFEGDAYEKKNIYSIREGQLPPVNYDEHIFRSHSLTHLETPAHTLANGQKLGLYYSKHINMFYGRTIVIRLPGNKYNHISGDIFHWVISLAELKVKIDSLRLTSFPEKILITTEMYPQNSFGYHDPNYVLTLSQEAADYFVSHKEFHLYGTSWKSSDFNPGKSDRPIHNTIFKKALILENLNLKNVPEGIYFMSAFPLPISDASESPVVPILFEKEELVF